MSLFLFTSFIEIFPIYFMVTQANCKYLQEKVLLLTFMIIINENSHTLQNSLVALSENSIIFTEI